MTSSRTAYVVRGQRVRVHAPRRLMPCIIVPGILGSRLTDPKDDSLVWNPYGFPIGAGPRLFKVDTARLQQKSVRLVADETNGYESQFRHERVQHIRHYYNLVPEMYGRLATQLARMRIAVGDLELQTQVYACGYDWRQDNAQSAQRLSEVVDEALRETGERKVVLICHGMGGLVARYYCYALGGESRVFAIFLVGSPTLGSPDAYLDLKRGVSGFYVKEFADNIKDLADADDALADPGKLKDVIVETANWGSALAGVGGWTGLSSAFGELYLALCLGAGKFLSRQESIYLMRQIPSAYQLLPSALYFKANPYWLLYDPLATGYPPTGEMLVFPTTLEAPFAFSRMAHALAGAENLTDNIDAEEVNGIFEPLDEFEKDLRRFWGIDDSERTSGRATRNVTTVFEKLAEVANTWANEEYGSSWSERDEEEKHGEIFGEGVSSLIDTIKVAVDIYKRIDAMSFYDGNAGKIYRDIYTGFVDFLPLRSLGATGVATAMRFQDMLMVGSIDNLEPPEDSELKVDTTGWESFVDGVKTALYFIPFSCTGLAWAHTASLHGVKNPADTYRKLQEDRIGKERKASIDKRLACKTRSGAYMHPRSYNIYCGNLPTQPGGFLMPTGVLSNDDSNEVRWELVPHFVAQITGAAGSLGADDAMGDGRVPRRSGNPDDALLARSFVDSHEVPGVKHGDLLCNAQVITYIEGKLTERAFVADFLKS